MTDEDIRVRVDGVWDTVCVGDKVFVLDPVDERDGELLPEAVTEVDMEQVDWVGFELVSLKLLDGDVDALCVKVRVSDVLPVRLRDSVAERRHDTELLSDRVLVGDADTVHEKVGDGLGDLGDLERLHEHDPDP